MNLKSSYALIAGLLFLPILLLSQNAPQAATEETSAFISHIEGIVSFQNFEKAELQMIVKPGDELITGKGMVEIELADRNWVRLGPQTRVVFTDLQKETAILSVWQGSIYLQLTDQTVKVRSPQRERSFRGGRLYRVDVEKNKTDVYEDPRVVDKFDSWSRGLTEETVYREYEPYPRRDYAYSGGMGWTFSPWWPWSRLDWVMGWSPFWHHYDPYFWSFHIWPTWYFGWNPYWSWNSWYYGYSPYYFGYGYGFYGNYFPGFYGRSGRTVIRKDQLQEPRGIVRTANPVLRSSPSSLSPRGKIYPSRIAPSNRTSSSLSSSRIYSRPSRSYSPRLTVPRSFSSSSYRSFSGPSISRSFSPRSSGRSSGGTRRR